MIEKIQMLFHHSSHRRVMWSFISPYEDPMSLISSTSRGVREFPVYIEQGKSKDVIGELVRFNQGSNKYSIEFIPNNSVDYKMFKALKQRWGSRLYATPEFIRDGDKIVGLRGIYMEVKYPVARTLPFIKESWGGD